MTPRQYRASRLALALSTALIPAVATAQATAPALSVDNSNAGWLYRGSDIPPDKAWVFGELPNGLRYAVRRNGVPPGQVSIRIAVDAGSLHERADERGFAHFNEHLAFRGSQYVPDGEAKRLWQRLGATFGSDTNASTTPTQTIYKIDVPNVTRAGLDDSMRVLSGMLAAPTITQAEVDAERRTVLAELREGSSAQQRIGDATRGLFFHGQPLGIGSPIGKSAALTAATPQSLRAFHDRWYRPDNVVIAIAGDADPSVFEAMVKKHFAAWKRPAAPIPAVDFGRPDARAPRARIVVEPGVATVVSMAVLRPWQQQRDTVEYNRGNLIQSVAIRVINRRLETRARAGGSFLSASIGQDKIARSVDGTFVQVVPIGNDWEAAVRDVRAVIADALTRPATQAEIDREAGEFSAAMQAGVDTRANDSGAELADNLIEAVNIRETVASPEVARDVFSLMKDRLTPAAIMNATRAVMTGTPLRAVLITGKTEAGAETKLIRALNAQVGAVSTVTASSVTFDRVPAIGAPGKVIATAALPQVGLQLLTLDNGVRVVLYPHPAEAGKVLVAARFGTGLRGLPRDRQTPVFAGESALIASGIGTLGQEELDALTSARRITLNLDVEDDAFVLKGTTNAAELGDQLKLMAAKLAHPRWDPQPVLRTRAAMLLGQNSYRSSPAGVAGRALPGFLHGGDVRWAVPERKAIEALTPDAFRAFWAPVLASGPVELSIYGDFSVADATAAAAATFGALAKRAPAPVVDTAGASLRPSATPLRLTHDGPADQAAAVIAWKTGGGLADVQEAHRLEILAQVFNDRLFDKLREGEGASYSPSVSSRWSSSFTDTGTVVAFSQVQPGAVDRFLTLSRSIAADLGTNPVTADELVRARDPMVQLIQRASTGSTFWLSQLGGVSFDSRRADALRALPVNLRAVTPADLMATARKWLTPERSATMIVLPKKGTAR